MSQIALPLTLEGTDGPARIVVGNANRKVAEALGNPSAWPFRTAILTGPARSGKSLLASWFADQEAGDGAEMEREVLDGADALDETALFHRWNRAQEGGTALLLVSDSDPWDIGLADLRSRLGAALHLEIGVPDDEMVAALIESHAQRRGLNLGEGARAYLVPRVERSFAGIEELVGVIDRLSLERKAPPTMSVWRDALEAVHWGGRGPEQARLL